MDAFDDAFGESPTVAVPKSNGNGNGLSDDDADPAADFLAREQSNFAGLEDEIPAVPNETNGSLTNGNGNGLAEDLDALSIGGGNNDILSNDRPPSPLSSSSPQTVFVQREEPEKIRLWREQQKMRLEVKDAEEEESKQKLREAAKKELEEWYKNYDEQIAKTRNSNRTAEQEGAAANASPVEDGKEWERIANLCDFNPKSSKQQKDISRMRSLILQLKQNPPTSRRQSSAGSSKSS